MPRTVVLTLPVDLTETVIGEIQSVDGIVGVRLERGSSLRPPGDVVTVELLNRALPALLSLFERHGLGTRAGSSLSTSEPVSLVSASAREAIARDSSDASWEDMEGSLAKESNMTLNAMALMFVSGAIAAIGVTTNAIHLVIGAMVIAPGFEPITRLALGCVARGPAWKRGLVDSALAYLVLAAGAGVAALALRASGHHPPGGSASYLPQSSLLTYWTSFTLPSLLVSGLASVAGALLIATNRSVLTAGVMIGLALVPAASIAVMAALVADWHAAGAAALRWLVEVGIVTLGSLAVFGWKRHSLHRRDTMA